MVFPNKHIRTSESLIGLGAFVLELLNQPKSLDMLWSEIRKTQIDGNFSNHNFENLVLSVDILFATGSIKVNENGFLKKMLRPRANEGIN